MYFFMFAYDNLPDQADAHRQRKKRDHTGTWKHVFMFHGDSFDLYFYISCNMSVCNLTASYACAFCFDKTLL